MLKRRKLRSDESTENHERWLVSYADFITLLFAFFIVMYAISSINEDKYRVLSHSLVSAFKSSNSSSLISAQSTEFTPIHIPQSEQVNSIRPIDELSSSKAKKQEKMRSMAKSILHALEPLVKDGQVRVTQSSLGITVEINASVLFSPGQAKLADNSSLALQAVAHVIKDHEHEIQVEGHTDNLPIHTENFPSNWELSAARASSVIRLFVENGVEASRLTAVGYGENRPMETNETPEGRKRNRRVAVMILATDPDKVTEIPIGRDTKN
ncbi:chemotaxis protein MotB [Nitrosomonas sp. Nm84]|uniref:flagellar motor protein MotD n=1 Tax=Nitrosomonas sp. Nm84 TaxID=200124 RepID=UPI000D75ECBA|nr:flagellar motor protein MotD [Nitrosomonas sp. Nm84]PXW91358.1 chemotaxis protein MotB [Nitrosomonas sp. Nm84]